MFFSINVNFCKDLSKNIKVFFKNAVIHDVRLIKQEGVYNMFIMWPGCYSFRDEIKMIILWFKEQTEALVLKIYEIDRILNS